MKKLILILIIILVLFSIIECTKTLRLFDIYGLVNISHDAWLSFFGSILQCVIAFAGFIITIYIFIMEREEKEIPLITIKSAKEADCNYICNNEDRKFTQHTDVYIELINKGDIVIKNPIIKSNENIVNNIYRLGTEKELDIIEPQNLQASNKYVICIDINFFEGMR